MYLTEKKTAADRVSRGSQRVSDWLRPAAGHRDLIEVLFGSRGAGDTIAVSDQSAVSVRS